MRITFRIPDEVGKKAEQLAEEKGMSVSSLYAEVIEIYVKEERRKRAFERINSLIGKAYVAPDIQKHLDEIRKDDPERI